MGHSLGVQVQPARRLTLKAVLEHSLSVEVKSLEAVLEHSLSVEVKSLEAVLGGALVYGALAHKRKG
jgi:hypothetical protein